MDHSEDVFRALNDASRRLLLDRLFEVDGQTTGELCEHLPGMTRYGVMNHLRILETAGLITTRRAGRSKHHYLNPVPIRLVHDRWISKYTAPIIGHIAGVKSRLEGGTTVANPSHVYKAVIAAPAAAVFNAITDGDMTVQYYYGTRVESSWQVGAPIRYMGPDGSVVADGAVLAFDPNKRVEMTFHARWDPDIEREGPVQMAWIVEEDGKTTTLTVEYYDVEPGSKTEADFNGGIAYIVSGLKTLVETGKPLAG